MFLDTLSEFDDLWANKERIKRAALWKLYMCQEFTFLKMSQEYY